MHHRRLHGILVASLTYQNGSEKFTTHKSPAAKAMGPANDGTRGELLRRSETYREKGLKIMRKEVIEAMHI